MSRKGWAVRFVIASVVLLLPGAILLEHVPPAVDWLAVFAACLFVQFAPARKAERRGGATKRRRGDE